MLFGAELRCQLSRRCRLNLLLTCGRWTILSSPTSTNDPLPSSLLTTAPSRHRRHSFSLTWCAACTAGSAWASSRSGKAGMSTARRYGGVSRYCSNRATNAAAGLTVSSAVMAVSSNTTTSSTSNVAAARATAPTMAAAPCSEDAMSTMVLGMAMETVERCCIDDAAGSPPPAAALGRLFPMGGDVPEDGGVTGEGAVCRGVPAEGRS